MTFEGEVVEEEPEEHDQDSDDDDEEFFDALDSGPSFVMPTNASEAFTRKYSTNEFVRRARLPAYGP